MKARWQAEKQQIQNIQSLKERLDELRGEAERATRTGDLQRAAEIQYGELPRQQQDVGEAERRLTELREEGHALAEHDALLRELGRVTGT
jgi:ATP-dependent Clp protease ATP-binding subunit ClpB